MAILYFPDRIVTNYFISSLYSCHSSNNHHSAGSQSLHNAHKLSTKVLFALLMLTYTDSSILSWEIFFCFTGDSLAFHNGQQFSTKDRDNDGFSGGSCSHERKAAWWYGYCAYSSLNGPWAMGNSGETIYWHHWKGANIGLRKSKMMMRPLNHRHGWILLHCSPMRIQ